MRNHNDQAEDRHGSHVGSLAVTSTRIWLTTHARPATALAGRALASRSQAHREPDTEAKEHELEGDRRASQSPMTADLPPRKMRTPVTSSLAPIKEPKTDGCAMKTESHACMTQAGGLTHSAKSRYASVFPVARRKWTRLPPATQPPRQGDQGRPPRLFSLAGGLHPDPAATPSEP
jgi:hypothetical protein